jgi:hypothetical protein
MFQTIHTNNDTTLMTPNSDATMAQHAEGNSDKSITQGSKPRNVSFHIVAYT